MFSPCILTGRFPSAQSLPIIALISESLTRLVPWLAVRFAQQTPLGGIVRIQPVLWFCDKHQQARPEEPPVP